MNERAPMEVADSFTYILDTGLAPPPMRERIGGRVRDGSGNGHAEWDWYFDLGDKDRERYRRWMRVGGLAPDEWASTMGYEDVESAMGEWCAAIDHQRAKVVDRFGIDWDAEEPEPWQSEAEAALAEVVARSNLTDAEVAKLIQAAYAAHVIRTQGVELDPDDHPETLEPQGRTKVLRVPSMLGMMELAKLLDVRPGTIRVWKHRGKLPEPTETVSGRDLWSRVAITEFMEELRACG